MKTLYGKLALLLGGLLGATGLAYVLISQSLTEHAMEQARQRFNRDLARNLVEDQNLISGGRLDRQALKRTFERYMTINPEIEIYLLDPQGRILAYSAEPGAVKRNTVSLAPIRAFLSGDERFPILGDDPRSHDQRKSFSVTPIPSADAPEGYLYVVLRGSMYDSIARLYQDSLLVRLSAWALAASLLFGLITGLISFALLTRRLRRLADRMDEFRHSDFSGYTPYGGPGRDGDEIDQLGSHFDQMAQRMRDLITQLRERDTLRRELVSNISHDLRTPLACLHGYLETLQLKTLTPDERREYLDTALRHSGRLSRLVGELFELAKLDARAVQPRPELFPASELLQDIAQKFRLSAETRSIRLVTQLPSAPAFIKADIGLIERVMENLLSNALHHTPARGIVMLELDCGDNQALFAVTDTGEGIAPQELPRVFDRHFRGSGSLNDIDHLGLGLTIAQRIVALHGSELRVVSRPGTGTRFSFRLPLVAA